MKYKKNLSIQLFSYSLKQDFRLKFAKLTLLIIVMEVLNKR